jgi:hypothetical protein
MRIAGVRIRGTKIADANTIAVSSDEYFNLVTLLLPGNGTNGQTNNTFLDSSTNAFTITRNGNTTQGTFSPFSQTGWSGYFDGSGDYLTVADNAAFEFGSGDFTIECWVFNTGTNGFIVSQQDNNTAPGSSFILFISSGALVGLVYYNGSSVASITDPTSFPLNQWVHTALVRSSNTITLYLNGTSKGTAGVSSGINNSSQTLAIGARNNGGDPLTGYISNLRIVKGTAVYTSAFTPPTAPLTAITNTSLLTCQSNRFIDNSTNAFAITANGNTSVQAFAPFDPTAAYSAATVGGSAYFDGTGDYLSVPDNSGFDLDSTFTLEGWFYQPLAGDGIIFSRGGGGASWSTTNGQEYWANILSGLFYWQWNSSGSPAAITATAPAAGAWHHFAVGYNGTTTRLWIDGVSAGTSTSNYTLPTTRNITRVGLSSFASSPFTGYISSLRVIKGTDVYGVGNTSITVPTAPVTAIANTQLLLNYTNGGITDAAAKQVLETVGSAQISTAQSKWGGSSMAFDGNGDFLIAQNNPALQLGSDNFTIDGWFNLSAHVNQNWSICSKGSEWALIGDANRWVFQVNAAVNPFVIAWTPVYNIWYHFACVRNGSTTTMYINGNSIGSGTSANITNSTGVLRVGRYGTDATYDINGYIQDLRITKGVARYTSNFTPPTTAFPTQ